MSRFTSEKQPTKRGVRGPDKRTLILDAIMENLVGPDGEKFADKEAAEKAMYGEIVKRAINVRDPASAQLMKEVLLRMAPADKATLPSIEFPFRAEGSASEKITDVQAAVATGILPVDMGNTMVNMIVSGIKVYEVTELAERLARIEELLAKADE
jgi:hypothetical protein